MAQRWFCTGNLDLALTKAAAGFDVAYTGPHEGVFRFESVKQKALRAREQIAFETALELMFEQAHRADPAAQPRPLN